MNNLLANPARTAGKVRAILLSLLPLFVVACSNRESGSAPATELQAPRSLIATAVAHPDRLAGDSDEDAWRQPQAVLEFMGVVPGMNVLDYFAASGYYSELLSRSVGPEGSVIAYNNPAYAEFAGEKLSKRFENNRLGNVKVVTVPTNQLKLEANSLDGVLFVLSYHDLYWTPKDAKEPFGDPAQVTTSLFQAVKPGGMVIVVDHAAKPGSNTLKTVDTLHRIDPEVVKIDFGNAGFLLEEESMVLRHPDDDRSKPVVDEAIRHKTDQFIYRFRKPVQR